MMKPQEAVGAVPQEGFRPQAPAPQAPQAQAPAAPQGQQLSPEDLAALRQDPEISEAVAKFLGRQVSMEEVPDNILTVVAGMVHKLGVDGAVAEITKMVPPEMAQQLRAGAQR